MNECSSCNKNVTCDGSQKKNKHDLDPTMLNIVYDSKKESTIFSLPRKYTSTHNDSPPTLYLGIGKKYIDRLLDTEEVKKNQTQILGKWKKEHEKYIIQLKVYVSTVTNPQTVIRNSIFCKELGLVLQSIAFAEIPILKEHPNLLKTNIYIKFISNVPEYNRTEKWGKLCDWV